MSGVSGKGFFRPIITVQSELSFFDQWRRRISKAVFFIVISCTDQLVFLRDDLLWGKNGGVLSIKGTSW